MILFQFLSDDSILPTINTQNSLRNIVQFMSSSRRTYKIGLDFIHNRYNVDSIQQLLIESIKCFTITIPCLNYYNQHNKKSIKILRRLKVFPNELKYNTFAHDSTVVKHLFNLKPVGNYRTCFSFNQLSKEYIIFKIKLDHFDYFNKCNISLSLKFIGTDVLWQGSQLGTVEYFFLLHVHVSKLKRKCKYDNCAVKANNIYSLPVNIKRATNWLSNGNVVVLFNFIDDNIDIVRPYSINKIKVFCLDKNELKYFYTSAFDILKSTPRAIATFGFCNKC